LIFKKKEESCGYGIHQKKENKKGASWRYIYRRRRKNYCSVHDKYRHKDVEATVNQIKMLEDIGCDIIRVAVVDQEAAEAIKEIKKSIKIPWWLIFILIIGLPYPVWKTEQTR